MKTPYRPLRWGDRISKKINFSGKTEDENQLSDPTSDRFDEETESPKINFSDKTADENRLKAPHRPLRWGVESLKINFSGETK